MEKKSVQLTDKQFGILLENVKQIQYLQEKVNEFQIKQKEILSFHIGDIDFEKVKVELNFEKKQLIFSD